MKTAYSVPPDRNDLDAELTRLERFLDGRSTPNLSVHARIGLAVHMVRIIRLRAQLGDFGRRPASRAFDLAMPMPN